MDSVTLILAALAAGLASGTGEYAAQEIYARLRALIKRRFAGNPSAEKTLADHEVDADTYEQRLGKQLTAAGADRDEEILSAARALLEATGGIPAAAKYRVDAGKARGVQIGDHGTMTVTFGAASAENRSDH